MGYVNLAWVVLLYNGLSPESKDIFSELQVKFHNHGIGTTAFEVRGYDPKKNGLFGREASDQMGRIFENFKRKQIRLQSLMHQRSNYVRVRVYNPILVKGEEVFSWTISHSSGLEFSKNILTICNGKESQSKSCSNYTYIYKDYIPKKSLKDVTYYTMQSEEAENEEKTDSEDMTLLMLIKEKLQFSLKYKSGKDLKEQPNTIYPFFSNPTYPKEVATAVLHCNPTFVVFLRKPRRSDQVTALIKPFQWRVWVSMLVTFIISIPMLYGIAWLEGKMKNRNHPSMQDIFWLMIRTGLRQDITLQQFPGYKSQTAFFLCHCELYLLTAAYCGLVLSALASPSYERIPNTYEELEDAMEKGKYTIGIAKESIVYVTIKQKIPIFERYLSGVKLISSEQLLKEENLVDTFEHGVKRALTENYAFASIISDYENLGPRKEEIRIIRFGESDLRSCTSLITKINSPNIVEVKKTIQRMVEVGLVKNIFRENNDTPKNNTSDVHEPLLLEDIKPALYILILGTISASIVFVSEMIISKFRNISL